MFYRDFIRILEQEFPPESAIEGDRVGLQVQSSVELIRNVLVVYELTEEQIDEAEALGVDAIITFHPLIYRPIQTIIDDERVGRLTTRLIRNRLMLYTIHTNFDTHQDGTNSLIADKLNLSNRRYLIPMTNFNNKGMGIIGYLPQKMSNDEFIKLCYETFNCPLRYSNGKMDTINKVAVVGGSGSSFIADALKANADAYITGDISYHTFHAYSAHMLLIDAGHFETEQFIREALYRQVVGLFTNYGVKFYCATTYTNPMRYYPDTANYIEKQSNIYNINGKD